MYCKVCGSQLDATTGKCRNCGYELPEGVKSKFLEMNKHEAQIDTTGGSESEEAAATEETAKSNETEALEEARASATQSDSIAQKLPNTGETIAKGKAEASVQPLDSSKASKKGEEQKADQPKTVEKTSAESHKSETTGEDAVKENFSVWCILSVCSLLCGCFTFYKGYDRMVNYRNSDYSGSV